MLGLTVLVAAGAVWHHRKPTPRGAGESIGIESATSGPLPEPEPSASQILLAAPAQTLTAPPPSPRASTAQPFDFTGWKTAILDPASTPDAVAGETSIAGDAVSLRMTGSNDGVGGNRDAVVFHQRRFTGDWMLTARVAEVNGGVAGLMVRNDLELSHPCLAITLGEDGAVIAKTRLEPDTRAVASAPVQPGKPCWVRLTRRSATFTAEHSPDGVTWLPAGSLTPANLPASVPVGFITHALTKSGTATAIFDHLTFSSNP